MNLSGTSSRLFRPAATDGPVRVVKVLPTLYCGGTESHVMRLGGALDPGRFSWEIACLRRAGSFVSELERRQVPIREYRTATFRHGRALRQQARFARDLVRQGVQIVHAYSFYGNVFAIPPAKLVAPVVIASIRDRGPYLSPMQQRMQRYVCRFADRVLVNADSVKEWLVSDGYRPDQIVVIPNGIDLQRFEGPPEPDGARRELGVPAGAPLVLVVSRLTPLKGLEHFLEAAAHLRATMPDAHYAIVGEASPMERPYEEDLRRLADRLGLGDRVVFAGLRSDVPRLLGGATVSVLPSLSEALPNAVLESMAAGAPVVATRVGGTPEAVTDGVTGLLVPPADAAALAAAIRRVLTDPALARRLSEAGRRRVAERFSLDRMVRDTEQLYQDLLARKIRRRPLRTIVDRPAVKEPSGRALAPAQRPLEPLRWRVKITLASGISRTHDLYAKAARTRHRRRPLILGYHRIVESFERSVRTEMPGMLTSLTMFERHLDCIGRHFRFVGLDEIAERTSAGEPFRKPVAAVTFDDGYRDVYELAYPLLVKKGIPAAAFVVTDLLGTSGWQIHDRLYHLVSKLFAVSSNPRRLLSGLFSELRLPSDELLRAVHPSGDRACVVSRLLPALTQAEIAGLIHALEATVGNGAGPVPPVLDWSMVKEMHAAGFTIGSHTRTHASLPVEPPAVVAEELEGSKRALEAALGARVVHFAYPGGQFTPPVVDALARAGYRYGYTACPHGDPRHPDLTMQRLLLWEGSSADLAGRFSPAVLSCQAHDLWPPARRCGRVHAA